MSREGSIRLPLEPKHKHSNLEIKQIPRTSTSTRVV